MKPRLNRIVVPALLSLATIVVGLNAWLAFRSVSSLLESQFWVDHTRQVIVQLELIISSAKDAETGTRGFLITGRDEYLEPYINARRDLPKELDNFQSLTSDNAAQQARAAEMRAIINKRLAGFESPIAVRRQLGPGKPYIPDANGTGKAEMDHLRHVVDEAQQSEQQLLETRTRDVKSDITRTRFTIALASLLDFLLIMLMFRYFTRERRMRVAAEIAGERLDLARFEAEKQADEVRLLNATLESRVKARTAELETTNRELEAFSYSVSHDLRAPLRTIDGFSVALEEEYAQVLSGPGQDYIKRVRAGVGRMGMVIDALLQLSRVTRAEITREEVDLSQLAQSLAANLREENPSREIIFNIEPDLRAEGDAKLLGIALQNLLGNSVKFSARKPEAVIDFGWDKEKKAWFVRDNGAGFDMIYASKLFSAFNRLHGDKDFQGSGIGLATVARVIRRLGGQIWADSVVDRGATFWFTLG